MDSQSKNCLAKAFTSACTADSLEARLAKAREDHGASSIEMDKLDTNSDSMEACSDSGGASKEQMGSVQN